MTSKGTPNRIGVAIFGVGRIGQVHLRNILRLRKADVMYIVEEDLSHGQAMAERNLLGGAVKVIKPQDDQQAFDDPGVEAVIICTPTRTHEGLVKRALGAGKAVFCEKPLAWSQEGVESCYYAAEKHSTHLFCAFNRRHDPSVRLMRDRYRRGDIGQAQSLKTCSRDGEPPSAEYVKISGGIFHDCAIHDIDMICWVLGEYPISVFTQAHAFRKDIADSGDVDQVMILMKFPSGCVASIDLSRHAVYGYDQRFEMFGPKGMLEEHNKRPTTVIGYGDPGVVSYDIEKSFPQRYQESYELEMAHFLNVVLGIEDKLLVTKEEVLWVNRIASACEESYRTGEQVLLEQ